MANDNVENRSNSEQEKRKFLILFVIVIHCRHRDHKNFINLFARNVKRENERERAQSKRKYFAESLNFSVQQRIPLQLQCTRVRFQLVQRDVINAN